MHRASTITTHVFARCAAITLDQPAADRPELRPPDRCSPWRLCQVDSNDAGVHRVRLDRPRTTAKSRAASAISSRPSLHRERTDVPRLCPTRRVYLADPRVGLDVFIRARAGVRARRPGASVAMPSGAALSCATTNTRSRRRPVLRCHAHDDSVFGAALHHPRHGRAIRDEPFAFAERMSSLREARFCCFVRES